MQDSLLGVVIPCYSAHGHGTRLLRSCLGSIASQTVTPSQVVISAEQEFLADALDVADEFRSIPGLVVTANGRRRGIGGNSNSGLDMITTDYAWVMHQDDRLMSTNTVEKVIQDIEITGSPWLVMRPVAVDPLNSDSAGSEVGSPIWRGRGYLLTGRNPLGPPSTSVWRLANPLRFDESLSLLVDLDLYLSLNRFWRSTPTLTNSLVGVGVWSGQTQRILDRGSLLAELPRLWRRSLLDRRRASQATAATT